MQKTFRDESDARHDAAAVVPSAKRAATAEK